MLGNEYGVYVSDLENYLYCEHGTIKIKLQTGDVIKPNSITDTCLKAGERVLVHVGAEVYGQAYVGTGYPLFNESKKLCGALVMILPARHVRIKIDSESVADNAQDISASTEELSASAEEFAATTSELKDRVGQIQ